MRFISIIILIVVVLVVDYSMCGELEREYFESLVDLCKIWKKLL